MNRTISATLPFMLAAILLFAPACSRQNQAHTRGVYMLLDTSGTYATELEKAQKIINYLLGSLQPGDSLAVARINSGSFSEKNIVDQVTFDSRPSVTTNQKRIFAKKIDDFVKNVKSSPYTDISGGILQAAQWLNETRAGKKTILIFSDLQEDLPKGNVRKFRLPLTGFRVVALNVTKLRGDIVDPSVYLDRLASWRTKVESGGGKWVVINDLERLEPILAD